MKTAETPIYRPEIPDNIASNTESAVVELVVELVVKCWDESPDQRPQFDDVLKNLQRMSRGK